MKVVYAMTTAPVTMPSGARGVVQGGSHWPADDPVVQSHPQLFSEDARYGMHYSVEPEGYGEPPGGPVEQATAAPGERRQARRTER